ncbi:hypothetical protein MPH_12050 [Macrophomina phaseolina MS6]|uniref:Uncharacterized protein n=1 Tax=Macrophomina phaseolina (strain MS6) TaxID=1126212 RepID=K2QLT3_MACPH|nr:hypothetical protein MPH_12050 [Macrophomina phaseolina MS6]
MDAEARGPCCSQGRPRPIQGHGTPFCGLHVPVGNFFPCQCGRGGLRSAERSVLQGHIYCLHVIPRLWSSCNCCVLTCIWRMMSLLIETKYIEQSVLPTQTLRYSI